MHFFLTTLNSYSFIFIYCWLSEKKQEWRNAEMKKFSIITHWLSQNKRIESKFFFFQKITVILSRLFRFYVYVRFNSSVLNLRTFLFSVLYSFFGLKVKWNRTDADVWKGREKKKVTEASGSRHWSHFDLNITSKCGRMLNYTD